MCEYAALQSKADLEKIQQSLQIFLGRGEKTPKAAAAEDMLYVHQAEALVAGIVILALHIINKRAQI